MYRIFPQIERRTLTACIFVSLALSQSLQADPVIRGDASLVDVVLAALDTNREALSRGACEICMTFTNSLSETTASIELLWDGDSSYSSYEYSEDYLRGDAPTLHGHGLQIVRDERMIIFRPESSVCMIYPAEPRQHSFRYVRPPDICFHMTHLPELPWSRSFDNFDNHDPGVILTIEQSGEKIIAEFVGDDRAASLFEFSLAHGCNLTSWEFRNGSGELEAWQKQEWRQVEGVWYPALSEHQWDTTFRLEITNFDPNPTISPTSFSVESLQIPRGTRVVEKDEAGRTIADTGEVRSPNRDEQAELDRLIEEARTNGFATPERARPVD